MNDIRERIGIDLGAHMPIETALEWAGSKGIRSIDVRLGDDGNSFQSFDSARVAGVRHLAERCGTHLGLHTLSAVNVAEFAPYLSEAADAYLQTYIELAGPLGAAWIVVHAGYHFTDDYDRRRSTALKRLQRLADYARARKVTLLLENMNPEPADAEVHYLAHDVEECRFYFDHLDPETIRWSFTVNHAHMIPPGIEGFFQAFGSHRLGEVRLADNRGSKEEHLLPGEGTIDFRATLSMIEQSGYDGPYTLAFGTPEDMVAGRDTIARMAS